MPSFETHRLRVHDTARSPRARHAALRTCVVGFAVYGFRATYHHLSRSARIPALLESDPEALVRAVEELHEARTLWLEAESAFVARRRREKALGGRRIPPAGPDRAWVHLRRQEGSLAYCPDPTRHPTEPLPTVVSRILKDAAGDLYCRACGRDAGVTRWHTAWHIHRLCAACGVERARERTDLNRAVAEAREEQWRRIWRREA
ncbi:hypothetical protein ACFYRI_30445 [Streptomyces microflavus]|uniref:hypothetical protein n=1 Tax=Streptomyces microflavus TaxID=1919 RepID=UPI003674B338